MVSVPGELPGASVPRLVRLPAMVELPPKLLPLRMRTEEASEPLTTSLPLATVVSPV